MVEVDATRRQRVLRRVGSPVQPLPTVIVAEGDSNTVGSGCYAGLWAADNPSVDVTNKAVGGSGINDMTTRLLSVIALAPTHVTILIGANNLGTDPAG